MLNWVIFGQYSTNLSESNQSIQCFIGRAIKESFRHLGVESDKEESFQQSWNKCLTHQLPRETKTEILLKISIQYQPDKWWEKQKYQFGDY